jgi:uncharacterized protein (TIGR02145 family)
MKYRNYFHSSVATAIMCFIFMMPGCKKESDPNKLPTVSISSPADGAIFANDTTITITAEADDADGNIAEVKFYIDGVGKSFSSGFPYNYKWNTANESVGSHKIKVVAEDNENDTSSVEITIIIFGLSPIAEFSVNKTTLTLGETINFTDLSTQSPNSWLWNFGDGGSSTEQNPVHSYSSTGIYTVSLTAANNYGSDTTSKVDYITVVSAPKADFTVNKTTLITGETVSFTDRSDYVPTNWNWNFGDGTTSTGKNPTHTYNFPGKYTVKLRVENVTGADSIVKADFITVGNATSTVSDIEGNVYKTVTIGTQTWMAENLKSTTYNNGSPIPLVTDQDEWGSLTTPAYCWYDNNIANKTKYGALYNGYVVDAASNGGKNVCPSGWHVPSDNEWTVLTDYLTNNGYGYEGIGDDIAKSCASKWGWESSELIGSPGYDQESNNMSGFSGVPCGYRNLVAYRNVGIHCVWWSSSSFDNQYAWYRYLYYAEINFYQDWWDEGFGYSLRCIKN